jgi:type VI secretion system protein ImpA
MPETSTGTALLDPVNLWLLPLGDDQPCGPDLEYDDASLALRAAAGKPDSQFGPGEPPDWARIREIAESLFTRTRDSRVAMW